MPNRTAPAATADGIKRCRMIALRSWPGGRNTATAAAGRSARQTVRQGDAELNERRSLRIESAVFISRSHQRTTCCHWQQASQGSVAEASASSPDPSQSSPVWNAGHGEEVAAADGLDVVLERFAVQPILDFLELLVDVGAKGA